MKKSILIASLLTMMTAVGCSNDASSVKETQEKPAAQVNVETNNNQEYKKPMSDKELTDFILDTCEPIYNMVQLYVEIGNDEYKLASMETQERYEKIESQFLLLTNKYLNEVRPQLPDNEIYTKFDQLLSKATEGMKLFQEAVYYDDIDKYKEANRPMKEISEMLRDFLIQYGNSPLFAD